MADSLVSFITTGIGPDQLERLFLQPYAVVAIFRSLPPLARNLLLRLACAGGEVSAALLLSWACSEGDSKLSAALKELASLRLLTQTSVSSQPAYAINTGFQAQLRHAMCSGLLAGRAAGQVPPADTLPSAAHLAEYARQQWEALLLFLVGGSSPPPAAPPALQGSAAPVDVPSLLSAAGLMIKDEYTLQQSISERGFQFLLADLYSQLWTVVRQYLASLELAGGAPAGGGADLGVAVNFLLRLGLQEGSRAMCLGQLAAEERVIAGHMAQLGLLMPVGAGGQLWLHPTRLAAVLAGGGRAGEAAAAPEDGFVIVESNFRVYAYTTSPVQVAVLRVFVRCDVLLPNLFVGTMTRDAAISALATGISADQIISFLRQHAHPRAAARSPTVPTVVTDQVRLWQQELSRLTAQAAAVYDRFESPELYSSAVQHARQLGALLHCCDDRRQLAVTQASHNLMRQHLKERKQALGL